MADQQVPQIPDTEIFIGNQFAGKDSDELDNLLEERRVEVDKLNEKSSDLWTQEENEEYKKLSAEIDAIKLAKLADENANCIARETAKGFTLKDAPECEKFFNKPFIHYCLLFICKFFVFRQRIYHNIMWMKVTMAKFFTFI